MQILKSKHILLGVTGSIAAYKSADLVRKLREEGALVRVVMTENAKRFITPLTMQAVSGCPVHEDLFDVQAEAAMGHIELSRWADLILVAPTSADFMARFANGHASDLLTTLCLATKSQIALAPAMNQGMWKNLLTQENLNKLLAKRIMILGPVSGNQACGDIGLGRMMEPIDIVEAVKKIFLTGVFSGKKVLVTAGPTQEPIDPVRYITNRSSGKMGYALAEAARDAGAVVTLISGPVHLKAPHGIEVINVHTAHEMYESVMRNIEDYDIFFAVAAVGDYSIENISGQKLHKTKENFELRLRQNLDIVANVANLKKKPFIVGFAAETENVIEQAKAKRQRKKMDMIIANDVSNAQGMGTDDNAITIIDMEEKEINLPLLQKTKLAVEIIKIIADKLKMESNDDHRTRSS